MNVVTHPGALEAARLEPLVERLARGAAAADESGRFPAGNLAVLHEAGLLALTVPRTYGGAGAGLAAAARVVRAVARGEPATALVLAMQYVQHGAARGWPEAQYARLARAAVQDGALINVLRVEPELGTPARGGLPATVARRTRDGWAIDGHKTFATGIPVLTWLSVWAVTDEAEPRVGSFLVPAGSPGITVLPTWDNLGMRATESHDVRFDGVVVPADAALELRAPAEWGAPDPRVGAWNALLLAAVYLGIAEAARAALADWLRRRVPANLGAPLATLPRFQAAFGEIEARLRLAGRLLEGAAEDADLERFGDAALVKQRVTADAIAAVEQAVALAAGAGVSRWHPLERHLRDVLCGRVHTPQDDSVFLAAGRAGLAIDGV